MKLAFIGTGVMGQSMAGHLLAAGHTLAVHNRTQSKARLLIDRGARWAATPADAARDAEVIFLCVADSPDVRAVCLGEAGVIATAARGSIVVDHSTISPAVTREVAAEFAARGIDFLDAPVSGGDIGAKNATLAIMVGGSETGLRKVEPLLRTMGKTITHMGDVGNGQLTKLVNQILVTVNNLATCEALTFAQKNGLNAEKVIEAIQGGAAGSWQLSNMGPRILKGDFRPGFTIDLQQKDLRLVLEAAEQSEVSLLAASLVHQLFSAAQAAGHGTEGTQSLFKVIEGLSQKH
jgi:3-hydroxyisobutyrate dehydrogenase